MGKLLEKIFSDRCISQRKRTQRIQVYCPEGDRVDYQGFSGWHSDGFWCCSCRWLNNRACADRFVSIDSSEYCCNNIYNPWQLVTGTLFIFKEIC